MKTKWIDVKDKNVCHIWKCGDCGDKAIVGPDWYQDNGTPVCPSCDRDMYYLKTQIKVENAKLLGK